MSTSRARWSVSARSRKRAVARREVRGDQDVVDLRAERRARSGPASSACGRRRRGGRRRAGRCRGCARKAAWSWEALKSPARMVGRCGPRRRRSPAARPSSRRHRPTGPAAGASGCASCSRTACPRTSATAPGMPMVPGIAARRPSAGTRLRTTDPVGAGALDGLPVRIARSRQGPLSASPSSCTRTPPRTRCPGCSAPDGGDQGVGGPPELHVRGQHPEVASTGPPGSLPFPYGSMNQASSPSTTRHPDHAGPPAGEQRRGRGRPRWGRAARAGRRGTGGRG